jgi:uncharacterized lipoprotein YajG
MRRLALGAMLLATSGCALTNMTITPPPAPLGAGLAGGNQRKVAVVAPFADDRLARDRCGMKKNGYNMDTANVYCSEEPARFLANLLASELAASGFQVVPPTAAAAVRIEGRLVQFFVEPKVGFLTFTPEADVAVRLVAISPTGLLAERDFYVKGIEESLVGTEDNFQRASNTAVRTVVKDMVAAIISLLDRYPDAQLRISAIPTT